MVWRVSATAPSDRAPGRWCQADDRSRLDTASGGVSELKRGGGGIRLRGEDRCRHCQSGPGAAHTRRLSLPMTQKVGTDRAEAPTGPSRLFEGGEARPCDSFTPVRGGAPWRRRGRRCHVTRALGGSPWRPGETAVPGLRRTDDRALQLVGDGGKSDVESDGVGGGQRRPWRRRPSVPTRDRGQHLPVPLGERCPDRNRPKARRRRCARRPGGTSGPGTSFGDGAERSGRGRVRAGARSAVDRTPADGDGAAPAAIPHPCSAARENGASAGTLWRHGPKCPTSGSRRPPRPVPRAARTLVSESARFDVCGWRAVSTLIAPQRSSLPGRRSETKRVVVLIWHCPTCPT